MELKVQKGWYLDQPDFDALNLKQDLSIPTPKGYDVLVQVIAAGLNPVDWKRVVFSGSPAFKFPGHIGLDCFGLIVKKGENVDETIIINETYIYFHGPLLRNEETGTFQQFTIQDSRYVSIIRKSLLETHQIKDLAGDLVSMICTGWTAYTIVQVKLKFLPGLQSHIPRNTVVVTAASGGVGAFCLQLLKIYRNSLTEEQKEKFIIIGTASPKNFDYIKSLGATHCVDYHSKNIYQEIKNITGLNKVDVWIDLVNQISAQEGLEHLKFNGDLVVAVANPDYDSSLLFSNQISIHNVALGAIYGTQNPEIIQTLKVIGDYFQENYENGQIKPIKYKTINLEQVKDALISIKEGKSNEKMVVLI